MVMKFGSEDFLFNAFILTWQYRIVLTNGIGRESSFSNLSKNILGFTLVAVGYIVHILFIVCYVCFEKMI
jgi:hypothetical protein